MTDAATTGESEATVDAGAEAVVTAEAGATVETAAAAESAKTEAPAAAAPVRPEGLPDEFWDEATGLKVGEIAAFIRETVAARADVPASADAYELKFSDDIKIPDGYQVEINKDDPLFKEVAAAAHAGGMPKGAFQKIVDAYAKAQIANQDRFVAEFAAERGKLGENAKARLEAASNWAATNLPKDQAEALLAVTDTAAGVQALETIISLRKDPAVAGSGSQLNGASPKSRAERLYG